MRVLSFISLFLIADVSAYVGGFSTRRSAMTMRKGRKSLKKTIKNSTRGGMAGTSAAAPENRSKTGGASWYPVKGIKSLDDITKEENVVQLIETQVKQLCDPRTNPNGAVGVLKTNGNTYSFSSSCPCCQIPLTKAKVREGTEETNGEPRLSCDFCATTFNIRTGEVVTSASKPGIMGSVVKGLFSKAEKEPLPVYALGEKNGQILISL